MCDLKPTNILKPILRDSIRSTNDPLDDKERIYKLKERVTTVQKKLENIEKTDKTARKLYSLLDSLESPVKLIQKRGGSGVVSNNNNNNNSNVNHQYSSVKIPKNRLNTTLNNTNNNNNSDYDILPQKQRHQQHQQHQHYRQNTTMNTTTTTTTNANTNTNGTMMTNAGLNTNGLASTLSKGEMCYYPMINLNNNTCNNNNNDDNNGGNGNGDHEGDRGSNGSAGGIDRGESYILNENSGVNDGNMSNSTLDMVHQHRLSYPQNVLLPVGQIPINGQLGQASQFNQIGQLGQASQLGQTSQHGQMGQLGQVIQPNQGGKFIQVWQPVHQYPISQGSDQRIHSLKEILDKIAKFKTTSYDPNKILGYIQGKIEFNKDLYYDYLHEKNEINLRVFIQILYEELENLFEMIALQQQQGQQQQQRQDEQGQEYGNQGYQIDLHQNNNGITTSIATNTTIDELNKKLIENEYILTKLTEDKLEYNKRIIELEDKLNKYNMLFIDVRIMLQNLIDELNTKLIIDNTDYLMNQITNTNPPSSSSSSTLINIPGTTTILPNTTTKMNFLHIIKAYMNQMNKAQMAINNEGMTTYAQLTCNNNDALTGGGGTNSNSSNNNGYLPRSTSTNIKSKSQNHNDMSYNNNNLSGYSTNNTAYTSATGTNGAYTIGANGLNGINGNKTSTNNPNGYSTTPNGCSTTPTGYSTNPNGCFTNPNGCSTTPNGYSTTSNGYSTTPNGYSTTPKGCSTNLNPTIYASNVNNSNNTSQYPIDEQGKIGYNNNKGYEYSNIVGLEDTRANTSGMNLSNLDIFEGRKNSQQQQQQEKSRNQSEDGNNVRCARVQDTHQHDKSFRLKGHGKLPQGQGQVGQGQVSQGQSLQTQPSQGQTWQAQPIQGQAQPIQGQAQPIQGQAWQAQPLQGQAQPPQGQPWQAQPPQGQTWQAQPTQGQPWQAQPPQGQPWQAQPPHGQPWQAQPPQVQLGQVWQGQPSQGSLIQGQMIQGQFSQGQAIPQGQTQAQLNQSFNQNYLLLLDELKKATLEKDELETKLHEANIKISKANEDFNDFSEKIKDLEYMLAENSNLQMKLKAISEEYNNKMQYYNEQVENLKREVKLYMEKYEKTNEEKKKIEKECQQMLNDKKEMLIKYEGLAQNMRTVEKAINDKDKKIDMMNQEKVAMENVICQLKDNEKKYRFDVKQSGDLENTLYLTQKELDIAKQAIEDYIEKVRKLQEENAQLLRRFEKNSDMPLASSKTRDNFAIEQMAMIILSKSKNGQQLDEETKLKLSSLFGPNFIEVLEPMNMKLKALEKSARYYKDKYQEKIWRYISRLEETKWLCNIILQNSEIISRSQNNQLPATLIMLKEDLEQKKISIQNKIKESAEEIEKFKDELRAMSEDDQKSIQEILSHRSKEGISCSERNTLTQEEQEAIYVDPLEFYRIKEDNEALKNKLQTQFYEISSLKSQLKLATSIEDTKRQVTMRESIKKPSKQGRFGSTSGKYYQMSSIQQPAEEDDLVSLGLNNQQYSLQQQQQQQQQQNSLQQQQQQQQQLNDQIYNIDYLLMMHIQATSLEMLMNNDIVA